MNTKSETETQQDFEALYLAYRAKYEAEMIRIDAQIKAIGELIESLREKSYD